MKKVNFKVVLMALSFAFSFLVLGVNRMDAQTSTTLTSAPGAPAPGSNKATAAVYSLPTGSFQGTAAAQNSLMDEMINLKGLLAQIQNESDPVFISTARTVRFYSAIHEALQGGQSVPQAIVTGLGSFNAADALTGAQLQGMRNAAIALLD